VSWRPPAAKGGAPRQEAREARRAAALCGGYPDGASQPGLVPQRLFGAGRPALTVKVHRWGIKEQKALRWYDEAAAYLVSRLQHVAHGTHRIKTEKGWMEFSAALRTEDKEALWRGFTSEHGADGVCRTAFHEMAATIANGQLKDLSALDVVAEFCGRTQFERLRSYLAEAVRDFAPSTKAHADFSRPARPVS